jgi:hypothetical protein
MIDQRDRVMAEPVPQSLPTPTVASGEGPGAATTSIASEQPGAEAQGQRFRISGLPLLLPSRVAQAKPQTICNAD